MFKKIKLLDIIITFIIIVLIFVCAYYFYNPLERNKLIIKIYPIQAYFEKKSLHCSPEAPNWIKNILLDSVIENQAPNNQIAYLDTRGNLHHCENGYLGVPLFSNKVTENTRFRYASISKLWTSDAILDLVKLKKIKLEDSVVKELDIVGEADLRVNNITVEHLLLHRGGFNRVSIFGDEMFKINSAPFCPKKVNELSKQKLNFEPGSKFIYSNLGYCLLGEIISAKSQLPYRDYIEKNYQLKRDNILFLENRRFGDEANYRYIENSLTGYNDIYTVFDYPALSSSAGLSGSAISLTLQVKKMIMKPQPNILSLSEQPCDLKKLRDCYGYAMFPYQKNKNSLKVYFRDGALLGMNSLVSVGENGAIVVLLSGGQAKDGERQYDKTKMKIYNQLNKI